MSEIISHTTLLSIGLTLLLADLVLAHPTFGANEYRYKNMIPQRDINGFASERQWLFANRKFRNKCVLEAVAAENSRSRMAAEVPAKGDRATPVGFVNTKDYPFPAL